MTDIRTRRRQAILEAAVDEFCQRGFERARMDAIASRAGIGKSTIYEYFPSKAALLEAVAEAVFQQITQELDTILDTDAPFRNKITSYMRFLDSLIARVGEKLLIIQREDGSLSLLNELSQRYLGELCGRLIESIRQAQAAGEVRAAVDPTTAAVILLSVPNPLGVRMGVRIEDLTDVLMKGIEA